MARAKALGGATPAPVPEPPGADGPPTLPLAAGSALAGAGRAAEASSAALSSVTRSLSLQGARRLGRCVEGLVARTHHFTCAAMPSAARCVVLPFDPWQAVHCAYMPSAARLLTLCRRCTAHRPRPQAHGNGTPQATGHRLHPTAQHTLGPEPDLTPHITHLASAAWRPAWELCHTCFR
jgi:hypothetical protein